MQKIDLTDVTFLIPVRIDSPERLENLKLTVQFLNSYLDTSILVLEADLKEQVQIPEGIKKWFVEDHDPVFHRTRYLNQMTRRVTSPYLAIWDADVIGIPSQLEAAVNLLREEKADMVFPYEKYFYAVPDLFKELYVNNNYRLDILEKGKEYMTPMHGSWSVGGAFLVNRQAYVEAGMENEHFYGWGPEDAERVVRWDTLGYRIKRVDGPLFHLPHPRKSWFDNKETEIRNRGEFLKVCAMNPQQLKEYVRDSEWIHPEHIWESNQSFKMQSIPGTIFRFERGRCRRLGKLILHFNTPEMTEQLCRMVPGAIVIDNGSTKHPYCGKNRCIRQENLGFTEGWNCAVKTLWNEFDMFWLMNSDIIIDPESVKRVEWIAATRLDVLFFTPAYNCWMKHCTPIPNEGLIEAPLMEFTAPVISRKVFETIGFFDKLFAKGYGVDFDFCYRVRQKRLKMYVDHKSSFYHLGHQTIAKHGGILQYRQEANREMENGLVSKYGPEYKSLIFEDVL